MTSHAYTYAGLTAGERLWLARRRSRTPLATMAKLMKVSTWKYGEWEHDRGGDDPIPYVHLVGDRLTSGEWCVLARRRAGWSLKRVAKEAGWSHVTVLKYERSKRGILRENPLAVWWEQHGWPRPARVAA